MNIWCSNKKNKIKKILLGNIPSVEVIEEQLQKKVPNSIKKVIVESKEDLLNIKNFLLKKNIEVLQYECNTLEDALNIRNGFLVCDDKMFVSQKIKNLSPLYGMVKNLITAPAGSYCPDIFLHDRYCILDGLKKEPYFFFKEKLKNNRKIITAFNKGHSDGIYTNVCGKIWLTNGKVLNFKKYFPNELVYDLSVTSGGIVNNWHDSNSFFNVSRELQKTAGRYFIAGQSMDESTISFIENYLKHWVGYCDETLFDINLLSLDDENAMVISQNSEVYKVLEDTGIKVHRVSWRHKFFWDGGLHCITNDIERERD
jgi:hypothetical protein